VPSTTCTTLPWLSFLQLCSPPFYHSRRRRLSSHGHLTGNSQRTLPSAHPVHMFMDTYIISHRCGALDRSRPPSVSTSPTPYSHDIFNNLLSDTDICEFDAVIVVDQPGVRPKTSSSQPRPLNLTLASPKSYMRPTCAPSPPPRPSQRACKTRLHPYNSPTCASPRPTKRPQGPSKTSPTK
jgi:hypothetical protein